MSHIKLASAATVIKPGVVKAVTVTDFEDVVVTTLAAYIRNCGYTETYPKFAGVNIGVVHPFALLLFQDIQGQKFDLNVFPSITVADNNDSEDSPTLSDGRRDVVLTADHVAKLEAAIAAGELFLSDSGLATLKAGTAGGANLTATIRSLTYRHTYSFSIWSDNRQITNILYDLVKSFILDQRLDLAKNKDIEFREISGSRTGDMNMDFGRILYGASMTIPAMTVQTVMSVDADFGIISEIQMELPNG